MTRALVENLTDFAHAFDRSAKVRLSILLALVITLLIVSTWPAP